MQQSVVDELIAQRDRVLFGKWVHRAPSEDGEACLLFYATHASMRAISPDAMMTIKAALGVEHLKEATRWNDRLATYQEVLDVLDEAIRLAKEST